MDFTHKQQKVAIIAVCCLSGFHFYSWEKKKALWVLFVYLFDTTWDVAALHGVCLCGRGDGGTEYLLAAGESLVSVSTFFSTC